jgi:hypothetical protein
LLGAAAALGCAADDDSSDEAASDEAADDEANADDGDGPAATATVPEGCKPDFDCKPVAPDTGDFYADCAARVNQFRACVCLPPLARRRDAEACLDQQAQFDVDNGAHAGFSGNICEPRGMAQNECPGWRDERHVVEDCLQMMFDEGPPPDERCEGQCYQEHGHHINMTGNYSEVSCGLYAAADGEVWSVHNFY